MILMVTAAKRAPEWVKDLETALRESIEIAETVKKAVAMVKSNTYSALVLDDPMIELEIEALDVLLHHSGMAVPVYVNFSISSSERLVRDIKYALRRNVEARRIAMRAAESMLRSELRDAVTGILLSTELAMKSSSLPVDAEEKLKNVSLLASQIRSRLESVQ